MSEPAIEVRGLEKSYGDVHAVRGIDLAVPRGEVFALLGPNGAGKTTTVEILEGYRTRTAGDVRVLGFDPARSERALKEQVGIVLQSTGVDPFLTVAETVDMYRGYYPRPRPRDEVIEVVGLQEKRDTRVRRLSGGQHRRLDVAVALAGDPDVLFLDEPTTGFDPNARRNAWDMVQNLQSLGKTVFLTTHYMDEAQVLADEVAVIVEGLIVARGTPDTLGGRDTATAIVRFRVDDGTLPDELARQVTFEQGMAEYRSEDPAAFLHALTGWALERGTGLDGLTVQRPTLEDVYLELTGEPVAEEL
ncbi:MAG: ABC transporter ATP-binding protein [Actinomycetota bacterium]